MTRSRLILRPMSPFCEEITPASDGSRIVRSLHKGTARLSAPSEKY